MRHCSTNVGHVQSCDSTNHSSQGGRSPIPRGLARSRACRSRQALPGSTLLLARICSTFKDYTQPISLFQLHKADSRGAPILAAMHTKQRAHKWPEPVLCRSCQLELLIRRRRPQLHASQVLDTAASWLDFRSTSKQLRNNAQRCKKCCFS